MEGLWKFMEVMLQQISHVENGFDVSKMVILVLKISLTQESQKFIYDEFEALIDEDLSPSVYSESVHDIHLL